MEKVKSTNQSKKLNAFFRINILGKQHKEKKAYIYTKETHITSKTKNEQILYSLCWGRESAYKEQE